MITQTAKAVISYFNQDENSALFRNALTGGLYFQQAPQDASSPYAVFYFIGASHQELMGDIWNNITDISLQFSIFEYSQDGGSNLASLAELLDNTFHWAEINVDGYKRIKMQRQSVGPVMYTDEIWQVNIDYELSIQKN